MILPLLLLVFLTYMTPSSSLMDNGSRLEAVHILFRHGDIGPEVLNVDRRYQNAPTDYNPHAHAKLTKSGRNQMYELGKYLRVRYNEAPLYNVYDRGDIYLQSTYIDHARESLRCMLIGFYPAQLEQEWDPDFKCMFNAYIESPEKNDDPVMWPIECPSYKKAREELKSDPEYIAIVNDEMIYAEKHEFLRYKLQNYNEKLIRLNGGMLLRKIVGDMLAAINPNVPYRILPRVGLYAGQEFNLIALLYALNVKWSPVVPTYSSAVIVELWQNLEVSNNNKYHINVLYHDGIKNETMTLKSQSCPRENMCRFNDITRAFGPLLPDTLLECDRKGMREIW